MPLFALLVVFFVSVLIGSLVAPQSAHAAGGVGGGGSGGGGSGGAQSTYGYGWYVFNTDGSNGTPGGLRNGGTWAGVQATCRDARANKIIAFIVRTSRRNVASSVVYNYTTKFGGSLYLGNSGGDWEPIPTAQAQFNSLPASGVSTAGFTFGGPNGNVAWFCYDYQPPQDYFLYPSVTTNRTVGETDQPVVVSPYVNNTGHAASSNSQWQLSQFVVAPGRSYPGGGNSPAAPAQYYGNGLTRLDGGGGASFPVGNYLIGNSVRNLPDFPVGTRICYALSVQPRAFDDGQWAHSPPTCVLIAKKPVVQILGGDLRVGAAFTGSTAPAASNIQTSIAIKAGKSYGSWGEYGLIASGAITGAASGSAYSGGLACVSGCAVNTMSFANESSPAGKYVVSTHIPDIASSFGVNASTPQYAGLGDAAFKRVETSNTDITISGGTIQKNQWLVINAPTKTVTITGDINYADAPLQSIGDIPQLVIIANQINIDGGVKNVDAWLVASGVTGTINTCSSWNGAGVAVTAQLTSGICNNALVVNGPVMAKKLYLRRTAGADTIAQAGVPAETINLRPDAYLWSIYQASQSARLETTYTADLPPRF